MLCRDQNFAYHGFVRIPDGTLLTIDVPGSTFTNARDVSHPFYGTEIVGYGLDSGNRYAGFLRLDKGRITTFEAPGAGNGTYQGTLAQAVNSAGSIAGYYIDTNGVEHGFLRVPTAGAPSKSSALKN